MRLLKTSIVFATLCVFAPLAFAADEGSAKEGSAPEGSAKEHAAKSVASSPKAVEPLEVGQKIPDVALHTPKGKEIKLHKFLSGKPAVLIFYRGGWCPYCNTHLSKMQEIEDDLSDMGYQILGISPDPYTKLKETVEKTGAKYTLLSDESFTAAKAFGVAFELDPETVKQYGEYGIDLGEPGSARHNRLPVPAVYIVKQDGTIAFRHYDPDYKERLEPGKALAAAKDAMQGHPEGSAHKEGS